MPSVNPLLAYMQEQGIKPYSRNSRLAQDVGVWWTFLGDIATGKRKCGPEILAKISAATDGEVTPTDMISHWFGSDQPSGENAVAVGG